MLRSNSNSPIPVELARRCLYPLDQASEIDLIGLVRLLLASLYFYVEQVQSDYLSLGWYQGFIISSGV